jgi:hypothetical protein
MIGMVVICNLDTDRATQALESRGYQKIKVHGFRLAGCGRSDVYSRGFTAELKGKTVRGQVCGRLFAGADIRVNND